MFQLIKIHHQNSLLDYYELHNSIVSCKIFPNLGASIQQLTVASTEIIQGMTAQESDLPYFRRYYPSSFLFPFPGRTAGGNYEYRGIKYQLPSNESGRNNAIHGFIAEAPFKLIKQNLGDKEASIVFQFEYDGTYPGFPFPAQLNVTYKLSANQLEVKVSVINTGTSTFPFGLGWHPYFEAENLTASTLKFDTSQQLTVDENQIPSGTKPNEFKTTIGEQELDDGFILNGATVTFNSTLYDMQMNVEAKDHNYLQLYTPPKRTSIAIEPMTCEPNVLNSGNGLLELAPDESFEWRIQLRFSFR
jgi:aldose 1-epimerase